MWRSRVVLLVIVGAAGLLVLGTYLAPVLEARGSVWGAGLRLLYAPACHQMPDRSLAVGGLPQAVCARCAGLYLGGVAGLACGALLTAWRRVRVPPVWILWALLPSALDFAVGLVGLGGLPNLPRLLLAFPAGFVAGAFLAGAAEQIVSPSQS